MSWCRDEDEHRRQAEDDYRRGGLYGYDREEYRNPWNERGAAYTREFDQEERREEEHREQRMEEEAYYQQAEQAYEQEYPEPEYPVECAHGDGREAVSGHRLCAQCLGEIGADA